MQVGQFCIISPSASIHPSCELDDYTAVYGNAVVGARSKILYGARIYDRAVIGSDCIIGGGVSERAVLGDRVTYMGSMAHSHYDASADWDSTDEPSARIEVGSFVGEGAILVGGIHLGAGCYVGAGEVLRHDLPRETVYLRGAIYPISHFRGLIKNRLEE